MGFEWFWLYFVIGSLAVILGYIASLINAGLDILEEILEKLKHF